MDLHVMLTTELQHFQVTAACHYNYEYSNIFPAVSTAFANHCSKAGVLSSPCGTFSEECY